VSKFEKKKLFFFDEAKKARVFVPEKTFHPGLIIESRQAPALFPSIRMGPGGLLGSNAIAYFA
jgi:hypothetical protein